MVPSTFGFKNGMTNLLTSEITNEIVIYSGEVIRAAIYKLDL